MKFDPYAIVVAREPIPKVSQEDRRRYGERGMSRAQAARLFDVNLSSVKRYARTLQQGDSLTPKWGAGRPRKLDKNAQVHLKEDVKERPSATISQRRRFLEHITREQILSDSIVGRLTKRPGFTQKGPWGRWNETSGWEQLGERWLAQPLDAR